VPDHIDVRCLEAKWPFGHSHYIDITRLRSLVSSNGTDDDDEAAFASLTDGVDDCGELIEFFRRKVLVDEDFVVADDG
jgi:hypothetical protein